MMWNSLTPSSPVSGFWIASRFVLYLRDYSSDSESVVRSEKPTSCSRTFADNICATTKSDTRPTATIPVNHGGLSNDESQTFTVLLSPMGRGGGRRSLGRLHIRGYPLQPPSPNPGQKHHLLTAPNPTPTGGVFVGGLVVVNSRSLIEMALGREDIISTMSIQRPG